MLSQNNVTHKRKFYLEVCSTSEISICGNYFEQNLMRNNLLIELNNKNFLKSYDTVYSFNYKFLTEVNNHIKKYNKYDSLTIVYPNKFLLKLNKFLTCEKLMEQSTNAFKYIPLNLNFNVEKIEEGEICLINPDFCNINNDDLFFTKKVIIVYIGNIYIDSKTTFREEFIYINKNGDIIKREPSSPKGSK